MAKFVFCLPRYHTNIVPWVRLLRQNKHEVAVHVTSIGPTENYRHLSPKYFAPSSFSLCVMRHSNNAGQNELRRAPGISCYWSAIRAEGPDVVIVRGATRWFSRLAIGIAFLQCARIIVYDQEDVVPAASSTWLRRAAFRALSIPHVTSRLPVSNSPKCFGSAIAVPFGCPFEEDRVREGWKRQMNWPPRILMVAKYRCRKGHHVLLEALRRLLAKHSFALTLCGEVITGADENYCAMLRQLITQFGLDGRVQFVNNVPHENMHELYTSHNLFVLPSRNEPAAISPIEAAWSGCGVLVSRDCGTRGYIPPGKEFEFDPCNPSELADTISKSIADPESLRAMRERCIRHISLVANDGLVLNRLEGLLRSKEN